MARVLVENISKNHEGWLKQKMLGIGSGDISTIVGANDFQTPLKLWAIRTGREQPDPENNHMWWGKEQERPIARFACRELKLMMVHPDAMFGHDDVTWAQASPDYYGVPELCNGDLTDIEMVKVIEVKNVGWRKRKDWADDNTPLAPVMQVHWQMGVLGYKHAIIAPMVGGDITDFRPRMVEFDKNIFEQLISLAEKFMWYVKNDTPPPVSSEDRKLVDKLCGAVDEVKTIELPNTPEILAHVQGFVKSKAEESVLNASLKLEKAIGEKHRNALRLVMGNAKYGTLGDYTVVANLVKKAGYPVKPSEYTTVKVTKKNVEEDDNDE